MKIAVIGSGIAGNVAAYYLSKQHHITVYESNSHIGGHTHTHEIELYGEQFRIDTGFIVFNRWTYPNFIHLLEELKVDIQLSNMSFSVKCEKTGLEYNGTSLNSLFAQRKNLLRPSFYRMISDILRFNELAKEFLHRNDTHTSLGEFLRERNFSENFIQHYVIPMGAAIWSAAPQTMLTIPAHFFIRFFNNHGMLSVNQRPDWYVIQNGSNSYVEKLVAGYRHNIQLNTPVISVKRHHNCVEIVDAHGQTQRYDQVFIACHSDQALKMLQDPSDDERRVLSAIPYQDNEIVLHTDTSVLPDNKRAWAAWNYHILAEQQSRVSVTYNMNILQSIKSQTTFCVTLNNTAAIDEHKIIKTLNYHHPVFTQQGVLAQQQQSKINGINNTYYCGAYWRNGFHEDGVVSALNALHDFNQRLKNEKLHLPRAS